MPYATETEFVDAFGAESAIELTNLEDPTATAVDSAVFDRVAADGDSLIDSYLSGRYALPLSAVPGVLRSLALDIYRYRLGHNAQEEDVRQRYEDALKTLQKIAEGLLNLGLPELDGPPGGPVAYHAPQAIFTSDSFGGYRF